MVATGRWKRAHMPDVSLACALAFHALFGAVHEASHLAAAWWVAPGSEKGGCGGDWSWAEGTPEAKLLPSGTVRS